MCTYLQTVYIFSVSRDQSVGRPVRVLWGDLPIHGRDSTFLQFLTNLEHLFSARI